MKNIIAIILFPFLSLFLSFLIIPNLTKPAYAAVGASSLTVTMGSCTADGTGVNVVFGWIPQANGALFQTDGEWLDVDITDNNFNPGQYISANVMGMSSYSTATGVGIGPLKPGTLHYWRINTHNQLEGPSPAGWHPVTGTPFTTTNCSIIGPGVGSDSLGTITAPGTIPTVNGDPSGFVAGLVRASISLLLIVAFLIALIWTIIAGIKLVTSGGDSKALGSAWSQIYWGLIGMLVVVGSFAIIKLIETFFGISILSGGLQLPTI